MLKSDINNLRNENISIKNDISNVNKEKQLLEKNLIKINSSIMKDEEFDIIKKAIEEKMNLKIKKINKLYQATIDGGDSSDFHRKCDNIENTLVLYESKGNRRFGGFASVSWETKKRINLTKIVFYFHSIIKGFFPSKMMIIIILFVPQTEGLVFFIKELFV